MESLGEIIERVSADLGASKELFTERTALAFAIAGCSFMLRDYLDLRVSSARPENATGDELEVWVARMGLKRKSKKRAVGFCQFFGVSGSMLPKGTRLRAGEYEYETCEEKIIAESGQVLVAVQGLKEVSDGNRAEATKFKLSSPVTGISSEVICFGIHGGEDEESDLSLRNRLLQSMKTRPRCGSKDDYIYWSESVPGVHKAWVKPLHEGPGTVGITWMEEDYAQSLSVQERLLAHLASTAPATARIVPILLKPIFVKISFAITPNLPQLRKEVEARLSRDFKVLAEPPGFFHYHERKTLDLIPRSRLEDSLRSVTGVDTYEILELPRLTCGFGEVLRLVF